jgi:hypothetical protein
MMVDTVDIVIDIDRSDIRLHISGNWLSDLGNIFTIFFKGPVVDLINTACEQALSTTLPNLINNALIENDGFIKFATENFVLDWESPSPAVVAETNWCLKTKGLFFDSQLGEIEPDTTIPSMPCNDSTSASLMQMFASTYSIDSLFQAGLAV